MAAHFVPVLEGNSLLVSLNDVIPLSNLLASVKQHKASLSKVLSCIRMHSEVSESKEPQVIN